MDKDVERVIDDSSLCGAKVLQKIEVWLSVAPKRQEFPVDNCLVRKTVLGVGNVLEFRVEDIMAARI